MSKIVLSIILPLYQAEKHIEELFLCLEQQTGLRKEMIEILLWDDGSTDATAATVPRHLSILREFGTVTLKRSKKNQGLSSTRLLAAQTAQGEFITFLDKQTRPIPDYIQQLLLQGHPLLVGNPTMDKQRSWWDRVLYLVRRKLYSPYFGQDFPDLTLTHAQYAGFKNKGGGGALLVRREWFVQAAQSIASGKHNNDDSLLIAALTQFSPLRKTAKAKILYLNRTGLTENIHHLILRGPKFIDYYLWPWNRYSPDIAGGIVLLLLQPFLLWVAPAVFLAELLLACIALIAVTLWLSEEIQDIVPTLTLLPIAVVSFSLGCLLGIGIKLQAVMRK